MKYVLVSEFTAQSKSVSALMQMFAQQEDKRAPNPPLLPIAVFMAFAVEAYLNSLGERHVPFWDQIEMISWRKKVEILHKVAGKPADWGRQPLQFARDLFELRDLLAHGRPERVESEPFATQEEADTAMRRAFEGPQPLWYTAITPEWAEQAKVRFTALMIYLGRLFGLHESDHLCSSRGGIERHS